MLGEQLNERRFIELYARTAVIFAALAAGRLIYIEICAVPLVANQTHLVLAAPALAVGAYYTFVRFRPLPATLFNGLGLVAFAFTGNVLSAILTMYSGRGFPMTDAALAAADRLVGFDWMGLLRLFDRHPGVNAALWPAYDSIMWQISLIIIVLALTRQADRMYRFMMAINLALVVTCAIAVFFPAFGPYQFYGVSPADHPNITLATQAKMTDAISWLRAAQWSVPAPRIEVGLISFPSFHTAAAVIYMWAMWRTPIARWVWLALNAMMLAATPIQGSHYVVDLFAGAAVAWIGILMAKWVLDARPRRIGSALHALVTRRAAAR